MAGRRRRKRRARGLFLLLVLALLIAGFMTRRLMLPRMFPRLGARSPATPAAAQTQSASNAPVANHNGSGEHLTDKDRKALDDVIRQKTGEAR